jgi:hypothetical protein
MSTGERKGQTAGSRLQTVDTPETQFEYGPSSDKPVRVAIMATITPNSMTNVLICVHLHYAAHSFCIPLLVSDVVTRLFE